MVSQQDIANRLGLSRSLVTKVLNGNLGTTQVRPETARAILDLADELGYRPNPRAVSLATGRSGTLGVMLRRYGIPAARLPDVLIEAIQGEAQRAGRKLLVTVYSNETEARCLELLEESRYIDGLIFAGRVYPDIARDLRRLRGVPVVTVCDEPIAATISHVGTDGAGIGYAAARHLIDRGCRRIAHIHTQDSHLAGWRQALREAGLEPDEALVFRATLHDHLNGAAAVRHFQAAGLSYDGLAAQSDAQAAGAINELQRRGVDVPREVKVIGVDNAPFCEYLPCPISSVDQNLHEAGRLGMQMLMQLVDDPATPVRHATAKPFVVPRRSTE